MRPDTKLIDRYDVIVVGGGPGGFGAGVAAARAGAKTVIIEREGCLGGAATTMLVNPFMTDRTSKGPAGEPPKVVNAGIFAELRERLTARGAYSERRAFDDETLKLVLDETAREAGADVLFHAALYDVEAEDGVVRAILLAHNAGPVRVTGKVFVDGTGDALLAARAGCEVMVGDEEGKVMPMTLFFAVSGADVARLPSRAELKKAAAAGADDDPPLRNLNFSTYSAAPNGLVYVNAIRMPGDTLDPADVSRAEAEGRRLVENMVAWLGARFPAFAGCRLMKTAAHVGVRESRRVVGDYVLTGDDFDSAAKFEDGVACSAYQVDIHGQKPNVSTHKQLPPGEYFHIPYRCVTPRGTRNLLVASRSVSADLVAHSSLRVMPVVTCIGQAAGLAAAMSLPAGDVRAVDVNALRAGIVEAGGVL